MAAPAPEQPLTFAARCRDEAAKANPLRFIQQSKELQEEIKRVFEAVKDACSDAAIKGDFTITLDSKALGIRPGQESVLLPKVAEMLEEKEEMGLSAKLVNVSINEHPRFIPPSTSLLLVSDIVQVVVRLGLEISW